MEDLREEADSREKGCLGRRKTKTIRAQTLLRRRDRETAYTVCSSLTGPGVPLTAPGRRGLVQLLPFQTVLRWALNTWRGEQSPGPSAPGEQAEPRGCWPSGQDPGSHTGAAAPGPASFGTRPAPSRDEPHHVPSLTHARAL